MIRGTNAWGPGALNRSTAAQMRRQANDFSLGCPIKSDPPTDPVNITPSNLSELSAKDSVQVRDGSTLDVRPFT